MTSLPSRTQTRARQQRQDRRRRMGPTLVDLPVTSPLCGGWKLRGKPGILYFVREGVLGWINPSSMLWDALPSLGAPSTAPSAERKSFRDDTASAALNQHCTGFLVKSWLAEFPKSTVTPHDSFTMPSPRHTWNSCSHLLWST